MNENGHEIRNALDPAGNLFVIERTSEFTLSAPNGDDYRIVIALPEGQMPPGGWPSLYLLDATASFGTCVEALRRMGRRPAATGVCPMIVVGISSAGGYDVARRQRDYTTPRSAPAAFAKEGGAPEFLGFLEAGVIAAIERLLPCDATRRTLCGHSLAGYFALWAMIERPALFSACAAISPSVWWDKASLLARARELGDQRGSILITVGEWEDALPPWQREAPDAASVRTRRAVRNMVSGSRDVAECMARHVGADRIHFSIMPEEDHASIVTSAMPRVLRLASQA